MSNEPIKVKRLSRKAVSIPTNSATLNEALSGLLVEVCVERHIYPEADPTYAVSISIPMGDNKDAAVALGEALASVENEG